MTEALNVAIDGNDPLTVAGRPVSGIELHQCGETPIADLRLPARAAAIVGRLGINTLGTLAAIPLSRLLELPGCSANVIHDLRSRVLGTLDSCAQGVQWKDSIVDRPLTAHEMKLLLGTPVTQLRITARTRAAVVACGAASSLDLALILRSSSALRGDRRSADKTIRDLEIAIWRVLEYEERLARRQLRVTVDRLRRQMPAAFAGTHPTVFGRPLSEEEEGLCRLAPLDTLSLSVRATNVLRGTDFATVFDVATANRQRILDLRNCGRTTLRELQLAIDELVAGKTLDLTMSSRVSPVSSDDFTGPVAEGTVFGRSLSTEEEAVCLATPADILGLSVRAMRVVNACSFNNALEIATASRDRLLELKNCGRTTLGELRAAVARAIEEVDKSGQGAESIPVDRLKEEIVSMLSNLDARSRFVLEGRFGLWNGNKQTLEQLASSLGGVTREYVRQIEAKAIKKLRGSLMRRRGMALLRDVRDSLFDQNRCPSFAGFLTVDDLGALLETGGAEPALSSRAAALRFLLGVFDDDFKCFKDGLRIEDDGRLWFRSDSDAVRFRRLESEARTVLTSRGKPMSVHAVVDALSRAGMETTELELSRLGSVSKEIGVSVGELAVRSWSSFRRGRAAARIERALSDLGEPTHYSYIVEKLNFLFPDKAPFVGHAISAAMLRYPEVFVSLGRGVYALRNWGVSRPPYVKKFVIDTLRAEGGQATVEQIAALGAKKYGFKRSSISMTLSLHPAFFERVRGTLFKLR
jgi:DNA-directed RNA polymerase alpha subunit